MPLPEPPEAPEHPPAQRLGVTPRSLLRGLLAGLFFGGLACLYALVPPSPDQFELTYVAWRLNAGARPYADVIDMNWPAAFWLHQLIAWLPQGPLYPWRLLDFAVTLAGVAAVARWLRRTPGLGRPAALAVLLGYPLLYADPRWYWFSGQRDALCFHLVLVAATLQGPAFSAGRRGPAAAVGALVGFATLVKPLALLAAPALLAYGLLRGGTPRARVRAFGWNCAGGLAVLGLAAAGLALQGAPWPETVDAAWTYNRIGQTDSGLSVGGLLRLAAAHAADSWAVLGPVAALGLLLGTPKRGTRDAALLAWTLLPAALAFYLLQGKGFAYHLAWAQGLVHLVALATVGACAGRVSRALAERRAGVRAWAAPAAAAALVCLVALAVAAKGASLRGPAAAMLGWLPRAEYLARFNAGPGTTFSQAEALATELRAAVPAGASPGAFPVLVYGDAVSINLMSGRPLPTAFYYPRVLKAMHGGDAGGTDGAGAELSARWDARFAAELAAARPPVVLVGADVLREAGEAGVPSAAALRAWLAEHYAPSGRVGGLLRYRLRSAG